MNRVFLGVILSIVWILIAVCAFLIGGFENIKQLKPNEWGDVLAGVTDPLAFIWLIIGYFQQGEELEKNTKALRLQEVALNKQTEELRCSVSHQAEIVELQKSELEIAKRANKLELEKYKKELKPDLVFTTISSEGHFENGFKQKVIIENRGHSIFKVWLHVTEGIKLDTELINVLYKDKDIEINFETPPYFTDSSESVFSIECKDGRDGIWVTEYAISMERDSGSLSFEKTKEWR